MAFHSKQCAMWFFLALLFLVCQTSAAAIDRVQNLCSFTLKPSQCLQILRADPRTVNATYQQLRNVTLELTLAAMVSGQDLSKSLLEQEKDPNVKPRFAGCLDAYQTAEESLRECVKDLFKGESYCLTILFSKVQACRNTFGAPPPEPTALKNVDDKVELLGVMVTLAFNLKDY